VKISFYLHLPETASGEKKLRNKTQIKSTQQKSHEIQKFGWAKNIKNQIKTPQHGFVD
jgi:hypothetical protein